MFSPFVVSQVGCISSGEGPRRGLHGNSKSDAVPDSWLIFCVLSYILVAKGKENFQAGIGAKRPTYGQNVLYGGTELYGLAPYICLYRIIR